METSFTWNNGHVSHSLFFAIFPYPKSICLRRQVLEAHISSRLRGEGRLWELCGGVSVTMLYPITVNRAVYWHYYRICSLRQLSEAKQTCGSGYVVWANGY